MMGLELGELERLLLAHCDDSVRLYPPVVVLKPEVIGLGPHVRIDSFVKLEGGLGMTIGPYVHIASFAHVGIGGGTTVIGDRAMVASGARILSGTNRPEGSSMSSAAPPDEQMIVRRTTVIEAEAFVGAGATILPGCVIGHHAVIGAGAVVTKDVPPWEMWAGNPAKRIGMRWPSR